MHSILDEAYVCHLGFVREGHQRERYEMLGEIQDAVLYGLLRRECRDEGVER